MNQSATPRVQLVVREQCHLCEQARRVVQSVCASVGADWEELDVDADPDLRNRYGELVPVVLVDGEQVGYWQVDAGRLKSALDGTGSAGARGLRARLRRRRA
ncbi:MAG TPA: glutaredoxin family protein [Beutenbergiaceae bacterium]|nr:glutaredoxin family protein [Beutenbergiaceae bacterium]